MFGETCKLLEENRLLNRGRLECDPDSIGLERVGRCGCQCKKKEVLTGKYAPTRSRRTFQWWAEETPPRACCCPLWPMRGRKYQQNNGGKQTCGNPHLPPLVCV